MWGDPVCEGTCDTIVLTGKVTSGSVAADGTVTLVGTAREIDKRRGEVIFDSEFDEPFTIVVGGSRPDDSFVLQWCLLPPFDIEGRMRVEIHDDEHGHDVRTLASSARRSSCSR